jgi:hypothetical protein
VTTTVIRDVVKDWTLVKLLNADQKARNLQFERDDEDNSDTESRQMTTLTI